MAKKKKKQKQKVKPNFMKVLGRSAGGAITEIEVKFGQALSDFGKPIIDLLSMPVLGNEQMYIQMFQEGMELTSIIWNGAKDNNLDETVAELKKDTKNSQIFNMEDLVPAMFERFNAMFPLFRNPSERTKIMVTKTLGEHPFDIYEFLSDNFNEKLALNLDDANEE